MICSSCGQKTADTLKKCVHCGAVLDKEAPAEKPAVPDTLPLTDAVLALQAKRQEEDPEILDEATLIFAAQEPLRRETRKEKEYDRSRRCLILLLWFLAFLIIFPALSPILSKHFSSEKKIQRAHINASGYKSQTWGKFLDEVCTDTSWEMYEDANFFTKVKCTGTKRTTGEKLEVIFSIIRAGRSWGFRVSKVCIDGSEYTVRSDQECVDRILEKPADRSKQ